MTPAELKQLIDACLEGDLSEADFLRLEAELSVDPAARREYYDRVGLSLLLEAEAAEQPVPSRNSEQSDLSDTVAGRWRRAFTTLAMVCAALLLVIGWQWRARSNEVPQAQSIAGSSADAGDDVEQQSSGFAIVSGQSEAVWARQQPLAAGSLAPTGELHLLSGVAQFELFSGVTLVVEGDARFSILSPMEVAVASGKVRARVPEPAHGFRVLMDAGDVVDLGTEFAINVAEDGSEVHVLDGEIEWHPKGLPSERLMQGDATRVAGEQQTRLTARTEDFVGPSELRQRLHEQQKSRIEDWERSSAAVSKDPRLIAHYRLTSDAVAQRRLGNRVDAATNRASEGAVVAAAPAANRWGQPESALDFSPAGSRVRLHVTGEHQHLTLIAWVRINSLDRWYNSLFLTDGHEQGEPHWQIMDDGRLFFSVKKRDVWDESKGEKDKHVFYSPKFWSASLSGRWLMLATVYDGANGKCTHYVNGEVLSEEEIPEEYLVTQIRIGDASLCNWGLPERNQPRFAIRNLNGSLDEFLMFREPLSSEEVRELYEQGRP